MKNSILFAFCAIVLLACSTVSRADLLTERYGINISDKKVHDNFAFFELFNNYFSDQLGTSGEGSYSSSNDLFNTRGVDPNRAWVTNGTEIVGAFKVAGYQHTLNVSSLDGSFNQSIYDVPSSTNIEGKLGLTDLTGIRVDDIPNGKELNLELHAKRPYGGDTDFIWSSNPEANDALQPTGYAGDGFIHMIALDITDLYNAKHGTDNESVFMFGFEDMHFTSGAGSYYSNIADGDYQDFVVIMTNLTPVPINTPEPATWLMFVVGGAGSSFLAWRKRKNAGKRSQAD